MVMMLSIEFRVANEKENSTKKCVMPAKVDLQISGIVGIHQIGVCACVSIEC